MRIAAIQMVSGSDVKVNQATILRQVQHASDSGATYIQFPEYCTYWGPSSGYEAAATNLNDEFFHQLGLHAKERGVTVHLGSVLERATDAKFFNTSVIIGSGGDILATYRKVHLFDARPPGGAAYLESLDFTPGESMKVVDVGDVRVGMSICFDVRFGELYRALALAGATVFAVPAAFSARTGPAHWEVLLRARAIENHAYVIAAAQSGTTEEGLMTHGHSMVIDPWGEVIAEAAGTGEEALIVDVDETLVRERRDQIEVLRLRRPQVYARDVEVISE